MSVMPWMTSGLVCSHPPKLPANKQSGCGGDHHMIEDPTWLQCDQPWLMSSQTAPPYFPLLYLILTNGPPFSHPLPTHTTTMNLSLPHNYYYSTIIINYLKNQEKNACAITKLPMNFVTNKATTSLCLFGHLSWKRRFGPLVAQCKHFFIKKVIKLLIVVIVISKLNLLCQLENKKYHRAN